MNARLLYEIKLVKGTFRVYSERPDFLVTKLTQIHSNLVLDEEIAEGKEADGILGNSTKPMAVLTADCIPLVLIGANSHAIIHAGWQGLQKKILENTFIKQMKPTHAFIGPHIRVNHYEVQTDFRNNFLNSASSFLEQNNQLFFDLTKEITFQLQTHFTEIIISDCNICTFSDKNFNSYRRNKTTERNWNIYIP